MQNEEKINETIISVKNFYKDFILDARHERGLLWFIVQLISRKPILRRRQVLKDINFDLKKGERLAIIGLNGAGKSTLLRAIAGIYSVDKGKIQVKGTSMYFSGFSQGMHQKLSTEENITKMLVLSGIHPIQSRKEVDRVLEIAELLPQKKDKLHTLSDGMVSRLAFATAMRSVEIVKPEILLLDEVFRAGGDLRFQKKAMEYLRNVVMGIPTLVFVTHSVDHAKDLCDKTLWIKDKTVHKIGPSSEVAEEYRVLYS